MRSGIASDSRWLPWTREWFTTPGVTLTASSYDSVVIVNEYGIADLRGLTAGEKALAVASIAHPKFREAYVREIYDDPMFTKDRGFALGDTPRGVTYYKGDIPLGA